MKDLIILILSTTHSSYAVLKKAIGDTWFKNNAAKLFFYHGDQSIRKTNLDGDTILCKTEDGIKDIGKKTIDAFSYICENYSFDYVARCCLGSYIDVSKMLEYLDDKPKNGFYSGSASDIVNGIPYVSGSCYFLSNDLVKNVCLGAKEWDHSLIDDVALGKYIRQKGLSIDKSCGGRVDVFKGDGISNIVERINKVDFPYHYHFCKMDGYMDMIHKYLNGVK